MRFLIFGAGAIGCVHGGFLAKAGHDVTLLGRPARMEAISQEGLLIDGIWGNHTISRLQTASSISELKNRDFEVILFTVRAYDTQDSVPQLKILCGSETLVVSLQNGLGNLEQITQAIGMDRTIGGRVIFGARFQDPNRVTVTVIADKTRIGPLPGGPPMEKVREIADILESAGLPTAPTDEIEKYIWAKVFYNAALNPLSALLNKTYGELADSPESRQIMDRVIDEAFAVAQAEGVSLFWDDPGEYRTIFYEREIPATRAHRSSMLQAIERGKRTEIDALNGAIVARGHRHGLDVSTNEYLVARLKDKERTSCSRTANGTQES